MPNVYATADVIEFQENNRMNYPVDCVTPQMLMEYQIKVLDLCIERATNILKQTVETVESNRLQVDALKQRKEQFQETLRNLLPNDGA